MAGYTAAELSELMREAYDAAALRSFSERGELSDELATIRKFRDFDYSPAAVQYINDAAQYSMANNEALPAVAGFTGGLENRNFLARDAQTGAMLPYTSPQLEQFAASGPLSDQFSARYDPTGENPDWDIGSITFDPNSDYRLVDRTTGEVVSSGRGFDAAQAILSGASGLYGSAGDKANFAIQRMAPGQDWQNVNYHDPKANGLGSFLKVALPLALGPLGAAGALGTAGAFGLGATATGALGAGLGSTLAGVANGDSLGDILKSAALSGGLSYLGGSVGGALGNGGASGATSAGSGVAGATGGATAGLGDIAEIVVNGISGAPAALGGALGSALGGLSFQTPQPAPASPEIVVTAPAAANPSALASGVAGGAGALAGATSTPDEIVVTGNQTSKPPSVLSDATLVPAAGVLANAGPLATETMPATSNGGGTSTLDKVISGSRLALLLAGLAGGGGGGGATAGAIPGGLNTGLNPTFNAQLPGATLPGLTAGAGMRTPNLTNQDWYRYGYGPEQSFFNQTPQTTPNTSRAFTGYAKGGRTGRGAPAAPKGALPTGRSDDVPAMLSEGEYVIDAETVALLGDGSNKAGADKLDRLRVNIRKHKGAKLAKGAISANAKEPERYLAGGLT